LGEGAGHGGRHVALARTRFEVGHAVSERPFVGEDALDGGN
jgi:hypothetical protein